MSPLILEDSPQILPSSSEPQIKTERTNHRRLIFSLIYGILALVVISAMTSGGMGVSFDSERYLYSAKDLRQGEIKDAYKTVFPDFPMFYPLAVAMVESFGMGEGVAGARIVSVLCFVVTMILVFWLGWEIQGEATSHLSALSLLIFAPLLYVFSYCWSETVFIPLSLMFLFSLNRYLKSPDEKSRKYLLVSAIFAGLAFFTRHIGISLIVTGLLVVFFLPKTKQLYQRIREMFSYGLVAGLPMLLYLIGAHFYLNNVTRVTSPSKFSFSDQLGLLTLTVYRDFLSFYLTFDQNIPLLVSPQLQDKLSHLLFCSNILIILCLLVCAFWFIKILISSRSFRSLLFSQRGILIYVAVYSLLLLIITSDIHVDRMGTRFVAPLYPPLFLLAFSTILHMIKTIDAKRLKRFLIGTTVLATALFWGIQGVSNYNIHKTARVGFFPSMEQPGNRNRESLRYLEDMLSSNDLIMTNIPNKLALIWPRATPYLGISMEKDSTSRHLVITHIPDTLSLVWPWDERYSHISGCGWNQSPNAIVSKSNSCSVYLLICPQDFSHYYMPTEVVEELNKKVGIYSWKKVLEKDLLYKTEVRVINSHTEKRRGKEKLVHLDD